MDAEDDHWGQEHRHGHVQVYARTGVNVHGMNMRSYEDVQIHACTVMNMHGCECVAMNTCRSKQAQV